MALLLSVQASADPAPAPAPGPIPAQFPIAGTSVPDGPAANELQELSSACGVASSDIEGVMLIPMGACDSDGCPAPTMDNMYCCCEETGTNMIGKLVNSGGDITIGG